MCGARGGALAGPGTVLGHAATSVRSCGSPVRRLGLRKPEERTVGHFFGSTGGRKRWRNAAAGSVRRCHPAPLRVVKRPVPCPSARVSRRVVVRALREMEGAKEGRTSVPVPAGVPWVTHAVCQPWGGTGSSRPAGVSAAVHVPRQSLERARTGTSQAAERGESPCTPSGDRAPPGTRSGTGGWEARSRVQGWRTPTRPLCPPRARGSSGRACQAAAEVGTSRVERPCCCARATGRRAAGSVQVTRPYGTGRRSGRCCASPRVAAACGHVGPGRCVHA